MTAQAGDTASLPVPLPKSEWRRILRARRKALPPRQARRLALRASRHLMRALCRRGARCVAVYLGYRSELSTAPLIRALQRGGRRVCVPRIDAGNRMRFVELRAGAPLRRNRYGIAEPLPGSVRLRLSQIDALVMPLTAFDGRGRRLGTGGGYYDRLLQHRRHAARPWRVGYAYGFQQVDRLPDEPWDVPLHAACTERGILRFT